MFVMYTFSDCAKIFLILNIILNNSNDSVAKASGSWAKIFKLGIAAGCHIGFGSYLAITVGGACPQIAATNPGLQKVCGCY